MDRVPNKKTITNNSGQELTIHYIKDEQLREAVELLMDERLYGGDGYSLALKVYDIWVRGDQNKYEIFF